MTRGIPIEAGDFFLRSKEPDVVRKLLYFSGRLWFYREYWVKDGPTSYVYDGSCMEASLKNWGTPITAERARELVPNLAELDRQKEGRDDEDRRSLNEMLISHALRSATDNQIREEAERRGLIPPRRPARGSSS